MIIWGSKAQERRIRSGSFNCPNCRTNAAYSLVRVSRYFTLFIPLFPTETLGEYVRCGNCHGELSPDVLGLTPEQVVADLEPWTCLKCDHLNDPGQRECLACATARPSQSAPLHRDTGTVAAAAPAAVGADSESYDY